MAGASERMKSMRDRRHALGLRELRLVVPDPRSHSVRQRIAVQVAALNQRDEHEALGWIEAIGEFDETSAQGGSATR